jgi:hypothetical protein
LHGKYGPGIFGSCRNEGRFAMLFRARGILLLAVLAAFTATQASAQTTITFDTPLGATTSGGAVDATATFTISGDTIEIMLTNLQANPTSVAQALSGLDFVLSTGRTSGVLSASSAQQVTILKNQTFTLGSTSVTGWGLNDGMRGGLQLTALGFSGPGTLLIGPSGGTTYSDANGSIAGNRPHNPFLSQSATFTITIPCLSGSASITSATFLFGTNGSNPESVVGIPAAPAVTPEPTTMLLFGSGLAALGAALRRKARSVV